MGEHRNVFTYSGRTREVTWDRRLCIHVGECTRAPGDLFVRGRTPWCDADGDGTDEVVRRCPTGALAYTTPDHDGEETPRRENTVVVSTRGPLYARGDLEIAGAGADMPGVRFRAALCRCGLSAQKPFCDGAHEAGGFEDRGAVGPTGTPLAEEGGPLAISPSRNGPLVVRGNVTIIAGHGRRAWQGTKAALCRCGHSRSKPFCDGSHTDAGFVAD